jgi:hypothetical protein
MARRILSADSALMPNAQASLHADGFAPAHAGFFGGLQERWRGALHLHPCEVLFDWADRRALMEEIAFVNEARERIDEAALRVAPAMLRIVLTVKEYLPDPTAQRGFLARHVDWDLRRISELCIAADSYGLLEPSHRVAGEREIQRYGWSSALKLAYVRERADRIEIWERAAGGRERASYRAVLEEMRRYRERKLLAPPAPPEEVQARLGALRRQLDALAALTGDLSAPESCRAALRQVATAQRELGRLKRALRERMEAGETEALAASA